MVTHAVWKRTFGLVLLEGNEHLAYAFLEYESFAYMSTALQFIK